MGLLCWLYAENAFFGGDVFLSDQSAESAASADCHTRLSLRALDIAVLPALDTKPQKNGLCSQRLRQANQALTGCTGTPQLSVTVFPAEKRPENALEEALLRRAENAVCTA